MFRRRKPQVRFPRYPLRWPWTLLWSLGLALATATLLAVGYLVAVQPPYDAPTPVGEVLATARTTGPAAVLAAVAIGAMGLCFRRLWLDLLAYRPGPVQVDTFMAGTVLDDANLEQLTLRFRQRFAELHLNAPASVPGALSDGQFLDVLGSSGVDSRNLLGSMVSLLRASKPRHAWQVSGVLVKRDEHPRHGLTVQVLRRPDEGNPPETIWGHSWDQVVRRGADHVTAAILPRTRRCSQQWAAWRRYRMPGKLLGAYEDAIEQEAARRYDEALDSYYRASAQDPMNMAIRLRIGQLQEKLGLYLDAFATYQGMRVVGEERKVPRRTRERRAARRGRRRTLVVADYRRSVLLGGSELAEQWRKTAPAGATISERDERRTTLRTRLRGQLVPELDAAVRESRTRRLRSRRGELDVITALEEPQPLPSRDRRSEADAEEATTRLFELRELFALAALRDLRRLRRELFLHHRDRRLILSRDSVKLTERCINVRLDWIQHRLPGSTPVAWPPDPKRLEAEIAAIERVRPFDRWHEHYNAACLYALPLMALPADRHASVCDDLAGRAVQRLASATAHADSAYIAGRRDWVLSEDPDLDGLRSHRFFKDFEAMNFPARDATPRRPLHVRTLESSRYVNDLLMETAKRWERVWHARGRRLDRPPDVHQLLSWWNDECEAWGRVHRVARNARHWPARVDLLHSLEGQAVAYGFAPLETPFPRYADRPASEGELGDGSHDADAIAAVAEARLRKIGKTVRDAEPPASAAITHIEKWQATLRNLDMRGREPRRFLVSVLCDHHAALWQLLQEWLAADIAAADERGERFKAQMASVDRVWQRAAAWWLSPTLVWAATRRGAKPMILPRRLAGNGAPTLGADVGAGPGAG